MIKETIVAKVVFFCDCTISSSCQDRFARQSTFKPGTSSWVFRNEFGATARGLFSSRVSCPASCAAVTRKFPFHHVSTSSRAAFFPPSKSE